MSAAAGILTFQACVFRPQTKHCTPIMQAQDATAVYLFKLWPWIEANKKRIIIGVGIIIAAIFIFSFVSWEKSKGEVDAGQALTSVMISTEGSQLADACLKIAADHPSTLAGQRALLQAAASLFEAGRYADSQTQFQNFLDQHPDSAFSGQAALGVAACIDAQGKPDLAVDAYQRAIGSLSDAEGTGVAKLAIARIYETQGKFKEAIALYGEVMHANPNGALGSEASVRAMELNAKSSSATGASATGPAVSLPAANVPFQLSH
jgi:predicted negative regulator of RcsB-dependent stress response